MSDSDAPAGRTYVDYRWDIRPDAREQWSFDRGYYYRDEDITEVKTPHVVPNGMWVMERPSGWAWLTGIEKSEVLFYTDKHGVKRDLRISDKPFGYIVADANDVDMTVYPRVIKPTGRKTLFSAKQIHKGELGQGVAIPRLDYVRQAFEPGRKLSVYKARERRRGYGWVRLLDLATAANLTVEEIVFGFWSYSGHRNYRYYEKNQDGGVLLDMTLALSAAEIKGKCPSVLSATQADAAMWLDTGPGDIWVRRGFAYTVLRLLALGVRPEVTQPA
jgi:hypothetical protein